MSERAFSPEGSLIYCSGSGQSKGNLPWQVFVSLRCKLGISKFNLGPTNVLWPYVSDTHRLGLQKGPVILSQRSPQTSNSY